MNKTNKTLLYTISYNEYLTLNVLNENEEQDWQQEEQYPGYQSV